MAVITDHPGVGVLHSHDTAPIIINPICSTVDRAGSLLTRPSFPGRIPRPIIFDLGDVLFTWSSTTSTSIPSRTLRMILGSTIWQSYECGLLSQIECHDRVAQEFSIPAAEIEAAFAQARDSLRAIETIVSFIQELR